MKVIDLKDMWQKTDDERPISFKTEDEIKKIFDGKPSGIMRKIRNKLIMEVLIYLALTYAYVDFFDALDKGLLIVSFAGSLITIGILNNLVFYNFLRIKILNEDLKSFLIKTIKRLRWQRVFRMFFFTIFILSMLLVLFPKDLTSMTDSKGGIIFLVVTVFSVGIKLASENQIWKEHINNLKQSLQNLIEE
jgi:hypothetical protein